MKNHTIPAGRIFALVAAVPGVEDSTAVAAELSAGVDGGDDWADLSDPLLDHLLIRVPHVLPGRLSGGSVPAY